MAISDFNLSISAFPQRWDAQNAQLELHVLVMPRGKPLEPLAMGALPARDAPAFAKAKLVLNAMLIPSLERLPDPADVTTSRPLNVVTPTNLEVLYREVAKRFTISPVTASTPKPQPRRKDTHFKKFLPPSYRSAFAFEQPRPGTFVNDTYKCTLQNPGPSKPPRPAPGPGFSWGQVLALILRQPLLAEKLGLVYRATVKLPTATFFKDGGWLFVALDPSSDFANLAQPAGEQVKYYAARLPALDATPRSLFAAVVFPVLSGPPTASYHENFIESEAYDDGFAKILHSSQPTKADFLEDEHGNGLPPTQDAGIQLGWDDEQLTTWMNRQIDPAFADQDSPMAVSAYRVDVRKAGTTAWTSLARVEGNLRLGTVLNETFKGEHGLQVAPVQLQGEKTGDYWLPAYFARWNGSSLVTRDEVLSELANGTATSPSTFKPVGLDQVPLRYGETYEFRVRLVDISGGGPGVGDRAVNPAPAPVATRRFLRFVPPGSVTITNLITPQDPSNPQQFFKIQRPRLGYPGLVFTDFPNAEQALLADLPKAKAEGRAVGLPDPDVATLQVSVEVRTQSTSGDVSPSFQPLYTTTRAFPDALSDSLDLALDFQDVPDVASLPLPASSGPLTVPRARDIRLTLTPLGKQDPNLRYFGSQEARVGMPVHIFTRAHSRDERNLFVPQSNGKRFQAILLQPDPVPNGNLVAQLAAAGRQDESPADLAQRLAQQLGLAVDGLTFFGKSGRRVVFGASKALRHTLAPDQSGITLSAKADLVNHWVAVVMLQINRDWTWDGLADVSFEIQREVKNLQTGRTEKDIVGAIEVRRTVNFTALQNPDRTKTDLFFFDAIDPKPSAGEFPPELEVTYTVTPLFKATPVRQDSPMTLRARLPMAVPPSQVPRLASAGLALSPYIRADDYSSTQPRQRVLWLEFEHPVEDQRDAYFARVLAYAPDPMLVEREPQEPPGPAEPPLPIDPELIRIITPGQSDDRTGLDAMLQLTQSSSSDRHFILPLPPGLSEDSLELFGFFVYEIRVGHAEGWSTAQGRFGPALRVTGVQHPAPASTSSVGREPRGITVNAPYATPVFEGRTLLPRIPKTEIWVLLYAQVTQVDGADRRNILLDRRAALPIHKRSDTHDTRDVLGRANWDQREIQVMLDALALRQDSPLSVLAVELLPDLERKPDPVGGDLGQVRILRTSPLTPVPPICL